MHAQRLIGADPTSVLKLPGADDVAAWEGVYGKLGRPDKADGYKFTDIKLPDGLAVDASLKTGFSEAAHKAGLSGKQADALYAWWNTEQGGRHTASGAETARQAQVAEQGLRTEWGTAFDQNVGMAKEAVRHYGGDTLTAELDRTGLGNHPELAKVFAKLGRNLQEDGVIGRAAGGGDLHSPGEAAQQISALQQDKVFLAAYQDKRAPGHADAVAKMAALYGQAHPPRA